MENNALKTPSRRKFFGSLASAGVAGMGLYGLPALATNQVGNVETLTDDLKITRVRFYKAPSRSMVNQSAHIVTVETDRGITGVGEGGTAFLVSQLAGLIIGKNPLRNEFLWQLMYRGHFYPPGREKIHALGAIDLALWDIKGKLLGVPVHMLLGGKARNYVECYTTAFRAEGTLEDRARAAMEAGFRAYRTGTADPRKGQPFNPHHAVYDTLKNCEAIRRGVGDDGDWCIDFHTRLDMNDAVRLAALIEDLEPYFVEEEKGREKK